MTTSEASETHSGAVSFLEEVRHAWKPGWEAAKTNFKPSLVLLAGIAMLVFSYYRFPDFARILDRIAAVNTAHPLIFGYLVGSLCGGVIAPALTWIFTPPSKRQSHRLSHHLFNLIYWGATAFIVGRFYALQAVWFGEGTDFKTLLIKTLVDQFGYSMCFINFVNVFFLTWRDEEFDWQRFRACMNRSMITKRLIPAVICNWCFWFPCLFFLYALPSTLQLPVGLLINVFWVLLINFVAGHAKKTAA